jgi:hypothetical protein
MQVPHPSRRTISVLTLLFALLSLLATHNGRKYLKTTADSYRPDNLLSLPECGS